MRYMVAAVLAASFCAITAQAQTAAVPEQTPTLTLEEAVRAAGGSAPSLEAGNAAIEAARAGRSAAGLLPNPIIQAEVENVLGSGGFRGARSAETTVGVAIPIELGGKRSARIAVADAQLTRAELLAAIAAADVRVQVTGLYVEAVAAERRVAAAREQLRIADELLRGASVRVRAGRASPLEEQRAGVSQVNAQVALERAARLAVAARAGLSLRIGRPVDGELDGTVLDVPPASPSGPPAPVVTAGTLALAAADAELAVADAGVGVARAARAPDIQVGPAIRRLEATDDLAAVFSISVPLPVFNNGRAALAQASAEWRRAEAQRRATVLEIAQAVTEAEAEAANAATTARATAGPALAAAEEAARIARIGYREGKFGQLELLDAERTLADTRVAVIDALASFQNARARLERLTAPAPQEGIR